MKCLTCKQEVEYPEFDCKKQPGKHTVESKTYYESGGAKHIASLRDRQFYSPQHVLVPGNYAKDGEGKMYHVPGVTVTFVRGMYTTADPEEQYHLDRKGFAHGEAGLHAWREVFLTEKQHLDIQREEIAKQKAEIADNNLLLAKVKGEKKEVANA
jgi:hypothetical protein